MLPAGLSPGAARPSGSLEAAWTKTKVEGREVARLLCVFHKRTSAFAPVRIRLTVFVIPCPLRPTCCYHTWKWNHMFPNGQHVNTASVRTHATTRNRPGKVLSQTSPTAVLPKHTQSRWAIGYFLMSNLFKRCYVICFPQPDAPSAVGLLIKVQSKKTDSSRHEPKQTTALGDYCKVRADCVWV